MVGSYWGRAKSGRIHWLIQNERMDRFGLLVGAPNKNKPHLRIWSAQVEVPMQKNRSGVLRKADSDRPGGHHPSIVALRGVLSLVLMLTNPSQDSLCLRCLRVTRNSFREPDLFEPHVDTCVKLENWKPCLAHFEWNHP